MNKLDTLKNIFEGSEIRSIWDNKKEECYDDLEVKLINMMYEQYAIEDSKK